MFNQSIFDPSRQTVGAIYRDAQINGERGVVIGDMNHEVVKDLVVDINEAIVHGKVVLEGRSFYLCIYEKKDLQMKKGDIRIRKIFLKRPYPEQDTMCFKIIPEADETYFCWCLPHRSQMINMINSADLYDPEDIAQLIRWENLQLEYFGFAKDSEGNWTENLFYRGDKLMGKRKEDDTTVSMHIKPQ